MSNKPTYKELEQRVKKLEQEAFERKRMEEALMESEERFRTAFEDAATGIALMANDGYFMQVNQTLCRILGYSEEELLSKTWVEITVAEDLEGCFDWLKRVKAGEQSAYEKRFIHKLGHSVWVIVSSSIVRDSQNRVRYYISLFQDISSRKQAEEALRENEAFIKAVMDNLPIGIAVNSVGPDVKFDYMNDNFPKYYRTTREALSDPDAFWDVVYEEAEFRKEIKKRVLNDCASGDPARMHWIDVPITRKGGETLFITARNIPIPDKQLMISTVWDVTARKQAEEALRESKEKYRSMMEAMDDAAYICSADLRVEYMNPAMIRKIGRDATGEACFKMVHGLDEQCSWCIHGKVMQGEHIKTEVVSPKNGKSFHVSNSPIFHTDGTISKLSIFRDITETKKMEEQLRQAQKMESIGTLAGGIAHDFNNILSIIVGNTELALDDVPEWNPARLNLEEVRTASLRAKDVVRQLLSFARRTKLEKKPTNIIPIIKESLKLMRSSIPASIEIRQNINKNVATILADPTQINQVLINLCTNADHAMPDGGIIEVNLRNVELDEDTEAQYPELTPGRYVNLTVSDTGHGIPHEEIDRIFDPYFTTKAVGKGTGMGLAVVHGIVKGHNGLITVESEPGQGSAFSIFFPAVEQDAVVEVKTFDELPTGSERILLVDDEESILRIGNQRLERLGYKVEQTTSPIEALNRFRSKPDRYDLVITDLTMPQMTGDKLVKEILNIRPDIPIILCTGFSEKIDEKKAREIGAADYVEKPLDQLDFAVKIRKVLDAE